MITLTAVVLTLSLALAARRLASRRWHVIGVPR